MGPQPVEPAFSMTSFAIALVLVSSCMHAAWNLLARYDRSETRFIGQMLFATFLVCLVPAVLLEIFTARLGVRAWACVLLAGTCSGVYYFGLARAYGMTDLTIVYPVVRSLPVLFVALGDVFSGRAVSSVGWLGLALIVVGCCLAPLRSFGDFSLRRYANRSTVWMLLAAAGTVGYSLIDKFGLESVTPGPMTAARYCCFFFITAYGVYLLLLRVTNHDTLVLRTTNWGLPMMAAVLNFTSYWLILWAYQMVLLAGYVVAFRQLSIVLAVVVALCIFKEEGRNVRLTGTILISAGLVLIGVWG